MGINKLRDEVDYSNKAIKFKSNKFKKYGHQ